MTLIESFEAHWASIHAGKGDPMTDSPPKPPFEFGQVVYRAWASSYAAEEVPCPICFGKRMVTLILGNGEAQPVECQGCGLGCEHARGWVTDRGVRSGVEPGVVNAMEWDGRKWRISCEGYLSNEHLFATEEEAEACRVVLHQEAEDNERRCFDDQMAHKKKKHGWTVRYHRDQIKDLQRKIAWHEARLANPPPVPVKATSNAELAS